MLLEMAIADAYGIAFEFIDKRDYEAYGLLNTLDRYYQHPEYAKLKPGQYTDDTQRAIANARVMKNFDPFSAHDYAMKYIDQFQFDPRDGYSRRYQEFLENTFDAGSFIQKIDRTKKSNGAIMGVAPLGYIKKVGEVRMAATIQAITTHSPATIPFACATALAAHYFIYKIGPANDLWKYLRDEVDWNGADMTPGVKWASDQELHQPVQMSAADTYYAVMRGLTEFRSLADIIEWAVDCGGDTDSTAAITVALASCSDEYEKDIPHVLFDNLENGHWGRDHIKQFDDFVKQEMTT